MISIIIPVRNNLLYTQMLIGLIEQTTKVYHEILIIDNASTEKGMGEYLVDFEKRQNHLTDFNKRRNHQVVFLPENFGIVKSWNFGVRMASQDTILIMNNDIVIGNRCIDELFMTLHNPYNGLFCVSPVYQDGDMRRDFKDLELKQRESIGKLVDGAVGCMFMFKKEVRDLIKPPKIGYLFDEQFTMFFEDTDFFVRMKQAGIPAKSRTSTCIHHFDRQTTGREPRIKELFKENYDRFVKKHPKALIEVDIDELIKKEL